MWTTLATFVLTLALVFGGAGASVYAAQDSLPNDFLYPVKTLSEDLRLGLAGSEGQQFNLALAFANKRVEEIKALKEKGEPLGELLQTPFQEQMNLAFQLMAGMSDEEIVPALIRTRAQVRTQLQTMEMLRTNFPDDVDPLMVQLQSMLQAQNRLVEAGLENPLFFRQQYRSWAGMGEPGYGEPATTQEPQGPGNEAAPGPQVTQPPQPPGENGAGPGPQETVPPGPPENSGNGPQPAEPGQGPGPGPDNGGSQGGQGEGPGNDSPGGNQGPGSGGQVAPPNSGNGPGSGTGSGTGSGSGTTQGSYPASSPPSSPPASGSGSTGSGSSGSGK